MLHFLLGLSLIYAAATGTILATDGAVRSDNPWVLTLGLNAWVIPVAAAWLAAEIIRAARAPRALNTAHSWSLARFTRGLVAGVLGVAASLAVLVYLDRELNDALVAGGGSAIASTLVLLCSRRPRPGACHGCGYDLRGLTAHARGCCPECGAPVASPA